MMTSSAEGILPPLKIDKNRVGFIPDVIETTIPDKSNLVSIFDNTDFKMTL
jgi:hypothetical protein